MRNTQSPTLFALGLAAILLTQATETHAQSVMTGSIVAKRSMKAAETSDDQMLITVAVPNPASYGMESLGRNYMCERNACGFVLHVDGSMHRYVTFDIGRPATEATPITHLRSLSVPVADVMNFMTLKFNNKNTLELRNLLLGAGHKVLTIESIAQAMRYFARGKPKYNLVRKEQSTELNLYDYEAVKVSRFLKDKVAPGRIGADDEVHDVRTNNVSCFSASRWCIVRIDQR